MGFVFQSYHLIPHQNSNSRISSIKTSSKKRPGYSEIEYNKTRKKKGRRHMIAEVIINSNVRNLNRVFDYNINEEMLPQITIGSRVLVPFGNTKKLEEGFVIGLKETSPFEVKEIAQVEKEQYLDEHKIQLAKWIAKRYFCNIADAIKLFLPPGKITKKIENRIKEKSIQCVFLKKEAEEIEEAIETKQIKSEKQIRILRFLLENEGVTTSDLSVYADASKAVIKTLEKNGFLEIQEKNIDRNPITDREIEKTSNLQFTKEQEEAYQEVAKTIEEESYTSFLLMGVTGSGKTEIYLQLIQKVLEKGKSALVLVPEISLTPQMIYRFASRFGKEKIAILHSKLSVGERYDEWRRIQRKEASIVIGARSAIFAPISNLGIIIIDEEHDSSYQSEMSPRYDAKEIAEYLAKENHIPCLLGSATPSINSFYQTKTGEKTLLVLNKRANHAPLPEVEIVDLRKELANGNRSMFSSRLQEEIAKTLKQKKQTILFLNRRGYSTFIMCRDCGYVAKCKNCNISLTYHAKTNKLKCHYCGFETDCITTCPECGSKKVRYFGTGTQKVEAEVHKLFPEATTIRMDVDTVSQKNSHEKILEAFQKEKIDILIGTQMVVKGHHFPDVTLVGVMAADSSLHMEDYRANERTFDLLVQVAGRAGREGNIPGKVIVQTYNTDSYSIVYAKDQDYLSFYEMEQTIRQSLKYPPFCDIIVLVVSSEKKELAQEVIQKLEKEIRPSLEQLENTYVYSPMPAPIDRIKNKYRFRMIIKCNFGDTIIDTLGNCLEKNKNAKAQIAVYRNPNNMI